MTAAPPKKIKLCPECNADNDDGAQRCWACRGDLAKAPEVVLAELVKEPGVKRSVAQGRITELLMLSVGGLIVCGALTQSVGLGIGLALVWVVALLVILLARPNARTSLVDRTVLERTPLPVAATSPSFYGDAPLGQSANLPLPPITSSSVIVRQVLVTLGVVALVMFAGFIALCVVCLAVFAPLLSGQHI